jgi:hypothetical protein
VLDKEDARGVLRAVVDGDVAGEDLNDEAFESRDATNRDNEEPFA